MVSEVETILNEIRDRVRAEAGPRSPDISLITQPQKTASGAGPTSEDQSQANESLARISAHLTTTARAWDKLPPVFSNRSGTPARLELWMKARLKSLSRWFTWEQVNFNAAVHHALMDSLEALSAQEQQLNRMRAEFARESDERRQGLERAMSELQQLRAALEKEAGEIRGQALHQTNALKAQSAALEAYSTEMRGAQAQTNKWLSDMSNETGTELSHLADRINVRLAELAADLREEQRVCFKQLSLEASEAAVLEDRGRRAVESRLKQLEETRKPDED